MAGPTLTDTCVIPGLSLVRAIVCWPLIGQLDLIITDTDTEISILDAYDLCGPISAMNEYWRGVKEKWMLDLT